MICLVPFTRPAGSATRFGRHEGDAFQIAHQHHTNTILRAMPKKIFRDHLKPCLIGNLNAVCIYGIHCR